MAAVVEERNFLRTRWEFAASMGGLAVIEEIGGQWRANTETMRNLDAALKRELGGSAVSAASAASASAAPEPETHGPAHDEQDDADNDHAASIAVNRK
jgi:hypothetical protein